MVPAALRFLAAAPRKGRPHLVLALARLAGDETGADIQGKLATDLASSPILLAEIRTLAQLDIAAHIAAADAIGQRQTTSAVHGSCYRLADAVPYAAAAERELRQATAHLRRIHAGTMPYEADKAFPPDDCAALGRFVRVALERDEAWLPPVLDELFRMASVAPTAAKTMPSQSISIVTGQAVEAFPTPEAVATLRGVLRDVRHAGVKKKLQRNLRLAERGLAARPDISLRLPVDQAVSKSQSIILSRGLEASLALGSTMAYEDWLARFAVHPHIRLMTGALVWQLSVPHGPSTSVLPVPGSDALFQDVGGTILTATSGARLALWHPAEATEDERAAWRGRLANLQLKQPFKQVFREHYAVEADERSANETSAFAGHAVSMTPFLGLAYREGWRSDDDGLTRSFGPWTAVFRLADFVHPGRSGATVTGKLVISTSIGEKLQVARMSDLPAATLSEILRGVDLLVSVGGFAIATEDMHPRRRARLRNLAKTPLGAMMETRKQALEHALGGLDGLADLRFDGHYLRLGAYAIHLSTGRVSRDGEPLIIDLPPKTNLGAVPWLPYDEALLEHICYTAIEIARRIKTEPIIPTRSSPAALT